MPRPSRALWGLCALAVLFGAAPARARPVIDVDFFRAMRSGDVGAHEISNNDLASLVGVLKYVHTEVIAEHTISPRVRSERKYGVDVISTWRFKVRNPLPLLSPTALPPLVQDVDFGPYTTFDHGVATNVVQQTTIADFGDFVGVQTQRDRRYVFNGPYYWYSVTGFCPNLQWGEKGTLDAPAADCLNYTDGGVVRGGLCPSGQDGGTLPTGEKGCTYTYGNASVVVLDELANITGQDCGGRRCQDWSDFRSHCTDASLRRYFDPSNKQITQFAYCVEYDINPACEADCNAEACLALPEEERELGLPFWRGRCSDMENTRRAEAVATLLGAAGDHAMSPVGSVPAEKCWYPGGMCNPSPQVGGMYCSRAWAGVCQPCFIPGADRSYPARDQPHCPYDVLRNVDYVGHRNVTVQCNSTRPRDLCCLYTNTCTVSAIHGYDAGYVATYPLDEDGFALAAFQQSTFVMKVFLERVALQLVHGVVEDAILDEIAYWQWDQYPVRGVSLATAEAALRLHAILFPTTTTSVTTTEEPDLLLAGACSTKALLTLVHMCAAAAMARPLLFW